MSKDKFLTTSEAARAAKLSAESIRAYERSGRLPAIKLNSGMRLFDEADVAALCKERGAKARAAKKPE